jgi:hypothetical protein
MLFSEHVQERWASSWALAWLGPTRAWRLPADPDVLGRLFELWRDGPVSDHTAGWALGAQPLVPRGENGPFSSIEPAGIRRLLEGYDELDSAEKLSTLLTAWYVQVLDDADIAQRAQALTSDELGPSLEHSLEDLLERVGVSKVGATGRRRKDRIQAS